MDKDHVNVFKDIAKICNPEGGPKRIRGAIVGTVDILKSGANINENLTADSNDTKALRRIKETLDIVANNVPTFQDLQMQDLQRQIQDLQNQYEQDLQRQIQNLQRQMQDPQNTPALSIVSGVKYYKCNKNDNGVYNYKFEGKFDLDQVFSKIIQGISNASSGIWCRFLHPEKDKTKKDANKLYEVGTDANAASIVTELIYAGKSILLTGDAPGKLFNSICSNPCNRPALQNIDVLVCPHHGSITNSSSRWLGELCTNIKFCSIISSNPNGRNKIPEVSFAMMGRCMVNAKRFAAHEVPCNRFLCHNKNNIMETMNWFTQNPIFITSSADICYHININSSGEIAIYNVTSEREEEIGVLENMQGSPVKPSANPQPPSSGWNDMPQEVTDYSSITFQHNKE
ncbi:MAG: hypothetical protein LBI37_01415 [Puniceicoccales bacterium]|nr:hypothetical protein [Puniceicoccales bacterium]